AQLDARNTGCPRDPRARRDARLVRSGRLVSMFDDLDPDFLPSPGAALPLVAARVGAVRKRRTVVVSGAVGAILLAWAVSTAFNGNGNAPARLTVTRRTTTSIATPPTIKTVATQP